MCRKESPRGGVVTVEFAPGRATANGQKLGALRHIVSGTDAHSTGCAPHLPNVEKRVTLFDHAQQPKRATWDVPSLDRLDRLWGRSSSSSRASATELRRTFRAWTGSFNRTSTANNSWDRSWSPKMARSSWTRDMDQPTLNGTFPIRLTPNSAWGR